MFIVRFTKFWSSLTVEQLGERAAQLGYDGLDLVVREGHAINPGNAARTLPGAVRGWAERGVRCGLITAETSLTDAGSASARALFDAAAEAGVPAIKIGYYVYQPGTSFDAAWDAAKRALDGFAALSEKTGVRTLYHTHSGLCLGSNCASLRQLLAGLEPSLVGAYVDLGHLAVNGEDVRIGLPMIRAHLAAVSAKDARHAPDRRPDRRAAYADVFVPLGQGAAEIHTAIGILKEWEFGGPLSVHTEYTADQEIVETVGGLDDTPEAQRLRERGEVDDLAYLRTALSQ